MNPIEASHRLQGLGEGLGTKPKSGDDKEFGPCVGLYSLTRDSVFGILFWNFYIATIERPQQSQLKI